MGFFSALGRLLRASDDSTLNTERSPTSEDRLRLLEAWGLSDTSHPEFPDGRAPAADPAEMAAPPVTTTYDRTQWERKLRSVLGDLPDSEGQWDNLLAEASALGFDDAWVRARQREEFTMLIRRAVADGRFSPQEHRSIELARVLIGLPDDEAETIARAVVSEAEEIFGREVEGKG